MRHTATLSANDDTCPSSSDNAGQFVVRPGRVGRGMIGNVSSSITVTLQEYDGANWIPVKSVDGNTTYSWTAAQTFTILDAGSYRLIASGVSSGSADCTLVEVQAP